MSAKTQKWWVLSAVACGTFMATLDSSIVNIALPTLTKEVGADLLRIKWVVVAYLLVITCLVLPFGRLSDQYGRKPTFQGGYLVFTLGSTLCGLAPNLLWLVVARALQGIGAAMLMSNGPAIITSAFPASERGKALGTLAMVVSAGLVSGPSIGGLLITLFGWRSIFLVNLPFGLLGFVLVQRYVLKDGRHSHRKPFDWAGAILQVFVLLSFIFLFDPPHISISGSQPLAVPPVVMMGITFVCTLVFGLVESQAKAPLLDLGLLRNRTFSAANLAGFFSFVAYSSVYVLMPFYLEEVLKYPTNETGLIMTAIPLTIFVVAPISGRLSDRLGSHELSFGGALVGSLTLFAMAGAFGRGLDASASAWVVLLALVAIGFGTGLFQSPNNNAIMGSVPTERLGIASAMLATVRNLGLVTGTGLATGVFSWRQKQTGDFVSALHSTHMIAAFIAGGAMFASLATRKGPHWYRAGEKNGLETKRT